MDPVDLSREQKKAHGELVSWWADSPDQHVTLGGYAGTGKTTLIGHTAQAIREMDRLFSIAYCCYTGKAARILKENLLSADALEPKDYCGTIHGLIYAPVTDERGRVVDWEKVDSIPYDLIVIDEASMVDEDIWNDLCSFGRRIIAVGDHGQLPPVKGKFNLMERPQLKLEEIHRQAAGNPIIKLSMMARTEGHIPFGKHGPGVEKMRKRSEETGSFLHAQYSEYDEDTLVLCGFNRTRVKLNLGIRETLGFEGHDPQPGERVICLRNNRFAKRCRIFNGMLGTVCSMSKEFREGFWYWYMARIDIDWEDRPYVGLVSRLQFDNMGTVNSVEGLELKEIGDLFDRGYALTVHKAQGSQAKKVILFEEPCKHWQGEAWNRWLYTAVTRAQEELYIVA